MVFSARAQARAASRTVIVVSGCSSQRRLHHAGECGPHGWQSLRQVVEIHDDAARQAAVAPM